MTDFTVTSMDELQRELNRMKGAVDGAMTPIMMIDRDLVITYANGATQNLMMKHEATLQSLYPSFTAAGLVGTCIDIFHKDPRHQRRMLADPGNLPYSTDIKVGPLTFRINVTALMDGNDYTGCNLEWQDVSEVRKKEERISRMTGAVDGLTTNLMMCDEDLNIIYLNPALQQMLSANQADIRDAIPGFDARNLVGTNIDIFHRHPDHQRRLLKDPSRMPHTAEIKVGSLEFRLNVTYIEDAHGRYIGNCVEWTDITEQMLAERQIDGLIQNAIDGRLAERIDTAPFSGTLKRIGDGINAILDAVTSPIQEATQVMEQVAGGDLTSRIDTEYSGDYAVLTQAINDSISNLLRTVTEVATSVEAIGSATSEIARGNTDLSNRTEDQASSLEQTAASMEQLSGSVKQNAENTQQANQLASGARQKADEGGQVVGHAVNAMSEIHKSSKKIADIIGVIDEIAFQTNLLALNAAVEAARAGEQGRGFAVVASEVRNLAQRSASAAKEIKALINDSVDKVEEGTRLVNASGDTLQAIVEAVKKVSDIIGEISASSHEQSVGIDEINTAVARLDQVTQANGALVEEAAAASESLNEQASALGRLMDFFTTEEGPAFGAPAPLAAAHQASRRAPQRSRRAPRQAQPTRRSASPRQNEVWEEF
ncbi:MAG: methyl-accepting chemotaxis protein [Bradymonadia bacterium]